MSTFNHQYSVAGAHSYTPGENGSADARRLALLEEYLAAGYSLTPVLPQSKVAFLHDWSTRDLSPDELRAMYASQPYNFGGRLGAPSGDLVDVDLDCPEALAIADRFLPSTEAVFGRNSKPRSHWLYHAALKSLKFVDPVGKKDVATGDGRKTDKERIVLLEVRSTGSQTVLPGSTHESGEEIQWFGPHSGIPPAARVAAERLVHAAKLLATTALLGRHYPEHGGRHEFELGVAGGLLRLGVDPEEAVSVLDEVALAAGVTPDGTARGKIYDTKNKLDNGENVYGWPTVRQALGDDSDAGKIIRAVIEWLANPSRAIRLQCDDFYAYLPSHKYLFRPTGDLWDISGVNGNIGTVADGFDADGNAVYWKPSAWLDAHRPVHQITWLPGAPELLEDVLVHEGGIVHEAGKRVYNQYKAPEPVEGDASNAEPWVKLIERLYPDHAGHIIAWLAHRIQRPGEKINHALVLGGSPGIGKDTLLEGAVHAAGPANCGEASPSNLIERFNEYLQSVILRVSEAKDMGEANRYAFYERTKTIIAAPPLTLRIDRKHVGAYRIPNVVGVVFTTNNRTNGLYLPKDDRRHFVVWSEVEPDDFEPDFFTDFYTWYMEGGFGHVRAYLEAYDLSSFNPKAPPPKTDAFWAMVKTNVSPEEGALSDVLDALGEEGEDGEIRRPAAFTIQLLLQKARDLSKAKTDGVYSGDEVDEFWELSQTLADRRQKSRLPHLFEGLDYIEILNPYAKDGRWSVNGKRQNIYALKTLSTRARIQAADRLVKGA